MPIEPDIILIHGAVVAALAAAILMGALRLDPRLFLRDQPAEHRALAPDLSKDEARKGLWVGLMLLIVIVGGPIASALTSAPAGPLAAGLHAFGVGMVFNLVDWLILDELWLGVFRPKWALMPEVRDVPFRFDHYRHFRGFLVGTGLYAVVGVISAIISLFLR